MARAALWSRRRRATGDSVDVPPPGLPPGAARFGLRRSWTRWWPVKAAAVVSLSLLHVKVRESPPVLLLLHFGPYTFNFVFDPDFCYIRFDLVRLGPSIAIN